MAPTTRGVRKQPKTIIEQTPTKDVARKATKASGKLPTKTISKTTKAKKPATAKSTGKAIAKRVVKQSTKESSTVRTIKKGVVDSPPMNYCEEDRRIHGTYTRCGAGALFMAHPNRTTSVSMASAMPSARNKTNASNRIIKSTKARNSDLDYDVVVRNGARMILNGLEDLWERISKEPMASEKSLQGVTKHMGEAIDAINAFLDSGRKYSNPHPKINFRKEFEEGDGVGNWIAFKPAWFEGGRFELGDIMTFQSALQGLKAEGEVVTLHR